MSKRFQPQTSKGSLGKKPRLEVNVSNKYYTNPAQISKTKNIDVWGDDDDDVILLASQALDRIEECSQSILIEHGSMFEATYSNFKINVQSSTQVTTHKEEENLKDLLQDDDDFANIGNFDSYIQSSDKNCPPKTNDDFDKNKPSTSTGSNTFKKPNLPSVSGVSHLKKKDKNSEADKPIRNHDNNIPIQVDYLLGKLDLTRRDNELLNEEVARYSEKFITKEGEVSMLRQELQHLKSKNETLRLEKLQENESSKKEYLDKIRELEKTIQAQKSELEFKKAEMLNIKSKRLHETQKLNDSLRIDDRAGVTPVTDLCNMFDLHLPFDLKGKQSIKVPPELFAKTQEGNEKFGEPLFRRELDNIRCIIGKLQTLDESNELYEKEVEQLRENMVISAKEIFKQAKKYAQQLKFTSYHDINASLEHTFLSKNMEEMLDSNSNKLSIYQEKAIYVDERAVVLRRAISALSILCEFPEAFAKKLYNQKIDDVELFEAIIETVDLIGYSEELHYHYGLIEAFGCLLNALIKTANENCVAEKYLAELLKSLIFCRPGHRPLVQLSKCFVYVTTKWKNLEFINSLCTKNPKDSFIANETYKIFHFASNACPVQVYGILLEVAIPQHGKLTESQIESLCSICMNHIIFLRNCIEKIPDWLWLAEESSGECDCYIKLSTSLVILFYLVVKQWINYPSTVDQKLVKRICRIGVILLYNVFCSNYRREILQVGGSAVKNRLQMLHYWLTEHQTDFEFTTIHTYALDSVKLSHIISDPIRNSEENYTEQSRADGNQIWEEIIETFFDDTTNVDEAFMSGVPET